MNHFRVYDVLIKTDLDVPCDGASLSQIDGQNTIDVVLRHRIRTLRPPRSLEKINEKYGGQLASFATRTGILLSLSDHSMLHVDDNRRIITIYTDQDHLKEATAFVTGLGISVFLLLQGYVTLHASSVKYRNQFIGIMADSGTGKSTILWALMRRGAKFVADDVLPVKTHMDSMLAVPSRSIHSRLWKQDLKRIGIPQEHCKEIFPGAGKFWAPINGTNRAIASEQLGILFVLQPVQGVPAARQPVLHRQIGASSISHLITHTHGAWTLSNRRLTALLPVYMVIAQSVPIYTIEYERRHDSTEAIIAAIDAVI